MQVWDEELENISQTFSEQCVFQRNVNLNDQLQFTTFMLVGENIARLGPLTTWGEKELSRILDDWNNEKDNYTLSTNKCSDVCKHYTQVIIFYIIIILIYKKEMKKGLARVIPIPTFVEVSCNEKRSDTRPTYLVILTIEITGVGSYGFVSIS